MPSNASSLFALGLAVALCGSAAAQTPLDTARQVDPHIGEMAVPMEVPQGIDDVTDRLRFEPWQLIDEMFTRDDVVFLMRHGPTDWSVRDPKRVDPGNCRETRVLSGQGEIDMFTMGLLMAHNDVMPGRIMVSEWCRNQQTKDALLEGIREIDPERAGAIDVETDASLNLLLHLDGAPSVTAMREAIAAWDGGDGTGPLMMISHYTNIEELTEFRIYEGEILILDPKRDGRVLGYLRLASATPDVGHFDIETGDEPVR